MMRVTRVLGIGMALAVATASTSVRAQDPAVTAQSEVPPSAAALALARLLGSSGTWWLRSRNSVEDTAAGIARSLLSAQLAWRGVGCEPKNPECRAIAERMGREAAPALVAARQEAGTRFIAYMIDEQMKPEEIIAATATVRSPGGRSVIRFFDTLADPARLSPAAGARLQQVMATTAPVIDRAFRDRFFDATKHLPRATSFAPPAPPAPTRARNTP